jgi:hypothetical protein
MFLRFWSKIERLGIFLTYKIFWLQKWFFYCNITFVRKRKGKRYQRLTPRETVSRKRRSTVREMGFSLAIVCATQHGRRKWRPLLRPLASASPPPHLHWPLSTGHAAGAPPPSDAPSPQPPVSGHRRSSWTLSSPRWRSHLTHLACSPPNFLLAKPLISSSIGQGT